MKLKRLSVLYAVSDFLGSGVAWTLFYLLKDNFGLRGPSASSFSGEYITGLMIIPVAWVFFFLLTGFYAVSLRRSRLVELIYSLVVTIPGVFIQFFILLLQGYITGNSQYLNFLEELFLFQF